MKRFLPFHFRVGVDSVDDVGAVKDKVDLEIALLRSRDSEVSGMALDTRTYKSRQLLPFSNKTFFPIFLKFCLIVSKSFSNSKTEEGEQLRKRFLTDHKKAKDIDYLNCKEPSFIIVLTKAF